MTEFEIYSEKSITHRFFKHSHVLTLLQKLDKNLFRIEEVGQSFQNRSINLVRTGKGATKVFLWSQMHGDEASATMALFDLFNFLSATDQNLLRQHILENCTLYIMPMVNPDGAEAFTRRNAQNIDINRDFNKQQSPEGILLRRMRDEISPEFAFNLHDMGMMWSVGNTGNPAAISLLAPQYDMQGSINEIRRKAMQVVSYINKKLQPIIPEHIGRWTDDYEPRAFGDNFQAAGSSTILIESGSYKNDPEKQYIRELTFAAILAGLEAVATQAYADESTESYFAIPDNEKRHFSMILRNCNISLDSKIYQADMGLIAEESLNKGGLPVSYSYIVEDMGDLTGFYGYEEIDAAGFKLILTRKPELKEPADFILTDGANSLLTFEAGKLTSRTI
ncbi:MAG: peptidase [Sphingobacteriaceae bacterium]|jgi:hypothetical protein|nr:peptidase [Sphingobacteriaceae bacterium]